MKIFSVNTQAHKRKFYPSSGKFFCYTTRDNGAFVLRNGEGTTLYRFKDEEDKKQRAQPMVDALKIIYRELENEYLAHKRLYPEYYSPTYEEANFAHRALANGFEPFPEYFCPYHNWFGVSACAYEGYTPDAVLKRGNKKIIISLQGIMMPIPKEQIEGWDEVANQCALKYLGFFIDDQAIYQTWFGQLPEIDFIEKFISVKAKA